MGEKVKAPKQKLNATDAVNGYIEAMTGLVHKHADGIFAYAKKSEDKTVQVKLVGTIDISQTNPKIELQIDVERKEKFKDNVVGEIDADQGKFRELLKEAAGHGGSDTTEAEEDSE
jgi:hypothetical protein